MHWKPQPIGSGCPADCQLCRRRAFANPRLSTNDEHLAPHDLAGSHKHDILVGLVCPKLRRLEESDSRFALWISCHCLQFDCGIFSFLELNYTRHDIFPLYAAACADGVVSFDSEDKSAHGFANAKAKASRACSSICSGFIRMKSLRSFTGFPSACMSPANE